MTIAGYVTVAATKKTNKKIRKALAILMVARLRKAYPWSRGQWIAGAIFTIPISILQKYY